MVKNNILRLSGWGRNIRSTCKVVEYSENLNLKDFMKKKLIARGMGRSYGDSSLQPKLTINMSNHNNVIKFDKKKGTISVESGASIGQLLELTVRFGWFMPVSPGTKNVTVGGMVASNVHGKNHHVDGGFSNFIKEISLINKDGKRIRCSKKYNSDLFVMTVGGMGLTGIITNVTFKLLKIETSKVLQKKIFTKDLKETMQVFEKEKNKYSVAWLDFSAKNKELGRCIIFLGEHATRRELQKANLVNNLNFKMRNFISIPFELPFSVLNYFSINLFNFLYYRFQKINSKKFVGIDKFFYPLDRIKNWNLVYGEKGFIQYQFVLPKIYSYDGIVEIIKYLQTVNQLPFLPVLKFFKKSDIGIMSFPIRGYTLAMDFPVSEKIISILNQLDKIVIKFKGRIYLTKDSRIRKNNFIKMYKKEIRFFKNSKYYKKGQFSSLQSERLLN